MRRKKNRRLLSELQSHKFFLSVAQANVWYAIINDEVFSNKLTPVPIFVRRLRGMWGYYEDEEAHLALNDWYPSKNLFLNILAHEMVHVHQHQTGVVVNHGKTFWEWRKRFRLNGLSLAVRYDGRSIK